MTTDSGRDSGREFIFVCQGCGRCQHEDKRCGCGKPNTKVQVRDEDVEGYDEWYVYGYADGYADGRRDGRSRIMMPSV